MSILSDQQILDEVKNQRITISPFNARNVQPSSVDLRLGHKFRVFNYDASLITGFIDSRSPDPELTRLVVLGLDEPFVIQPGQFVLGVTLEQIRLPNNILGRLEGRSSVGRLGLLVHATAGYIDPGFHGTLTLELSNLSPLPIAIYPNSCICQISFQYMSSPINRPYGEPGLGSKYQGQVDPEASKGI